MNKSVNEFLIKPKSGLIVRDPDTLEQLAASGESKPQNSYWLRRLHDGDVEIIESKKKRGAE
ncbi:DUF2635 domain-containing protein [Orbaceae bacterium ESL0721]|nr:DUF2635 domain-containing protein [Orbaceae bacterium ESL0721]